jgi:hypothetical protein
VIAVTRANLAVGISSEATMESCGFKRLWIQTSAESRDTPGDETHF